MEGKAIASCLGALMLAALLVPACLITDGSGGGADGECQTQCGEYWTCEYYCEGEVCEELGCSFEETCETVCDEGADFPDESEIFDEPAVCYSGIECHAGRVCRDGKCGPAASEERGGAGLCQACESQSDCSEAGSLCLGLNSGGEGGPTETVCGQPCGGDQDCPSGFDCLEVSGESEESDQCVPAVSDGARTCGGSSDLECISAGDCAVGESCVDNVCMPPSGAECTADGDCDSGERCHVFECVDDADGAECVGGPDCATDEVCVDGDCVAEAQGCVFNADCSDEERCVDGECVNTCESDSDCGTNQRCRQGICEYVECYQSGDCPSGHICVEASCQKSCGVDGDCPDGYLCSALGYCSADPDVECRSSAECASDQVCGEEGECVTPCDCNQQCDAGDVCGDSSGLCEEPDSGADEVQCDDDCDCPSGMTCDDGDCV